MGDYKYYGLHGESITQDKFIKLYSEIYFYLSDYRDEQRIEEIYNSDSALSVDQLITFLRWKVGDKHTEGDIITQYGKHIDCNCIKELSDDIDSKWKDTSSKEIYKRIVNKQIKNLGAVYTIALISVITKGREPIYDKFADIALSVIKTPSRGFREKWNYKEMPYKTNIEGVIKRYDEYKKSIAEVFGGKRRFDVLGRDVDRALWVYGHMFSG